jgi:fused signal recognition particle receptor
MGFFSFGRKKKVPAKPVESVDDGQTGNDISTDGVASAAAEPGIEPDTQPNAQPDPQPPAPASSRELDTKLVKTRSRFKDGLLNLLAGKRKIDDELLEELESELIMADVGIDTTARVMRELQENISRSQVKDAEALRELLRYTLVKMLEPREQALEVPDIGKPFVLLVVGVNGAGKTTTIGKMAKRLQDGGKSVMLAAGDTFRAAAVEQLQTWGERNNVPVIAQGNGADSASVIFDALQAATARKVDVLIADTAGRLHTQSNLMEELKKVVRVLKKLDPEAPHEVLMVIDGSTGQNALNQALQFDAAVDLSGLAVTKLDGTAKGGVLFSVADKLQVPIRFIGVGEKIEDLRSFDAAEFVQALLAD